MATMREIRSRIKATQKTSQITKAMNMVSASKMKKAERSIRNFRPLMKRLHLLIQNVLEHGDLNHPMMMERETKKTCYIIVSSDRGLAGPYNSSVFKAFQAYVKQAHNSMDEYVVAPIGYKAMTFVKHHQYPLLLDESIHVRDDIQFIDFQDVNKTFIEYYLSGTIDKIVVFYNHYINTLNQQVESFQLLPIKSIEEMSDADEKNHTDEHGVALIYDYEPSPSHIINQLLPMYVENMLYGIILDAKASEHAARMTAMKSATDNAQDIIHTLQLHYNRARQAAITIELTDIIGGANAVN